MVVGGYMKDFTSLLTIVLIRDSGLGTRDSSNESTKTSSEPRTPGAE